MLLFNLRDPSGTGRPHSILGDRRVRRAITMAIDRHAVVESALGLTARVAEGPLPRVLLDSLLLPDVPSDTAAAQRLLEAAGWLRDARDGVRRRNGHRLQLSLLIPAIGQQLSIAVLLQAQLRAVGIDLRIDESEFNTTVTRLAAGQFDATLLDLNWDPSPASVRQIWSTASLSPRGSNFGGYSNSRFDTLLDSAVGAGDYRSARLLYRRALSVLVGDAPAVWLYDVVNVGAVRKPVRPIGVRADAWWMDVGRWETTDAVR